VLETLENTWCVFTHRMYIDWKKLLAFFIVISFAIRELETLRSCENLIAIHAKGEYQYFKLHLLKVVSSV